MSGDFAGWEKSFVIRAYSDGHDNWFLNKEMKSAYNDRKVTFDSTAYNIRNAPLHCIDELFLIISPVAAALALPAMPTLCQGQLEREVYQIEFLGSPMRG